MSSVDRGIKGFRSRQNLAAVYAAMGEVAKAEEQWRTVVHEVPTYRAGWRGLGEMLLLQGKVDEAMSVADQLCGEEPITDRRGKPEDRWDKPGGSLTDGRDELEHRRGKPGGSREAMRNEGMVLRGRALAARGDVAGARREFEQAVAEFPDDLEPLQALCRLLFEHAGPADARGAIEELLRHEPHDAAAYHNLGSVCYRLGQYGASADAYRQSLRLRPSSASTYLHLGYALREAGDRKEACAAWEQTLRLAPGDSNAVEALRQARGH